jgi:RNA polymerase sigma-70 factor (ECF subfamily)
VARRILVDVLRARKARPPELMVTDLTGLSGSEDDMERLIAGLAVREAPAALRPERREVFVEVFYRGRTRRRWQRRWTFPLGTVKSRIQYVLRALRQRVAG